MCLYLLARKSWSGRLRVRRDWYSPNRCLFPGAPASDQVDDLLAGFSQIIHHGEGCFFAVRLPTGVQYTLRFWPFIFIQVIMLALAGIVLLDLASVKLQALLSSRQGLQCSILVSPMLA